MNNLLDKTVTLDDGSEITLRDIITDWFTEGSPYNSDKAKAEEFIEKLSS